MKTFKIILLLLVAVMLVSPVLMIFASSRQLPAHQAVELEKPAMTVLAQEVPAGAMVVQDAVVQEDAVQEDAAVAVEWDVTSLESDENSQNGLDADAQAIDPNELAAALQAAGQQVPVVPVVPFQEDQEDINPEYLAAMGQGDALP